MTKKIGDKKLGGIKSTAIETTKATTQVGGTEAVKGVTGVKATSGVGGVKGAGGIGKRKPTRIMTLAEREQLFQMINEEADKLLSSGAIPANKKEVITSAVKMTVEAGFVVEDEENQGKRKG